MISFFTRFRVSRLTPCPRPAMAYSLLLCLWFSNLVYADHNIVIISSSRAAIYQQTVTAFEQSLAHRELLKIHTLNQFVLDDLNEKDNILLGKGTKAVVVTVGSAAADYAIRHFVDTPIICGFITRNAFAAITSKRPSDNPVTAVFMDQPLSRLLNLASLLKKDQSPFKIGLLSQNTLADQDSANKAGFSTKDIEIESAMLVKDSNPVKIIEPLMKASDIFIVRPNTSLFNRLVAKLVLQLSMRYKTPVIGFSKNYAQAGALLSLYSSPEDIGVDIANIVDTWLRSKGQTMPAPSEGLNFSIEINQHVAKKMAATPDAEKLHSELQRKEGK